MTLPTIAMVHFLAIHQGVTLESTQPTAENRRGTGLALNGLHVGSASPTRRTEFGLRDAVGAGRVGFTTSKSGIVFFINMLCLDVVYATK